MTESHGLPLDATGRSRRKFLKQAATVAWATPLIVTMSSRRASAQPVQCGTLQLFSMPGGGSQLQCNVSNPCGSTDNCVPTGFLNPGDPCYCI